MSDIVDFKFTADSSGVSLALKQVRGDLQELSSADFAMGMEAVLGLFGKLKDAVVQLGQVFSSCMREAAALEEVGTRLGVMLNDAAGGDALASSLQRMATNGVVPLQELEKAASALTQSLSDPGEIAEWVGVFANISAGSDMTADRLAKMTARMEDMGKAEFTELSNAGIPIFTALSKVTGKTTDEIVKLGAEGKISTSTLLEAFKELTAEGEKYHDLNATMSNTTGGSWDTLAASFGEVMAEVGATLNDIVRPCLQEISEILQNHKGVIAELVRAAMIFATVWGGIAAVKMSQKLWQCVSAMVAMKAAGQGLLGIFRSIGKVGWMLVITTAVEALMALYDKFFSSSGGEVVPPQAEPEDFLAKTREKEKAEQDKRQRTALDEAKSVEDFNKILKDGGAPDDYDVEEGRRQASIREHEKKYQDERKKELEDLQKAEKARVDKKQADAFKKELEAFEKLHDWQQKKILGSRLNQAGIKRL